MIFKHEEEDKHSRNRFLAVFLFILGIFGIVLFRKYFNVDLLSFIMLLFIYIALFALIDFFLS